MGNERGSATVLMMVVVAVAALMTTVVTATTTAAVRRGQLDAIADLAALSGATGDAPAADRVAVANRARVALFTRDGDRVTVRVARGGTAADATAELVMGVPTTTVAASRP